MNTGTPESGYDYWLGKHNDGAMGWAFMESKRGNARIERRLTVEHGFMTVRLIWATRAIFRTAQTVLADDPLFGWFAYGGTLKYRKSFAVEPRDGVRAEVLGSHTGTGVYDGDGT